MDLQCGRINRRRECPFSNCPYVCNVSIVTDRSRRSKFLITLARMASAADPDQTFCTPAEMKFNYPLNTGMAVSL